jgi:hypothetical protein
MLADLLSWQAYHLGERESSRPPKRALLRFLQTVADGSLPEKWDSRLKRLVPNDDWLLFEHALENRATS